MIAPAVLISASGVSVLFTSERLQISPELTMTESDKEAYLNPFMPSRAC